MPPPSSGLAPQPGSLTGGAPPAPASPANTAIPANTANDTADETAANDTNAAADLTIDDAATTAAAPATSAREAPPAEVTSPAEPARAANPAPGRSGRRSNGTTRSWYLPRPVADDLSNAADALYFDLRGKHEKSEILGVLIRMGLDNMPRVRKRLGLPPA